MSVASQLTDSLVSMPEYLQTIASTDPVAAVLLAAGSLLIAVCVGAVAFFGLGALFEGLNPTGA